MSPPSRRPQQTRIQPISHEEDDTWSEEDDEEHITSSSDHSSEYEAPSPRRSGRPRLQHRIECAKSILALAVSDDSLFSGTQDGEILVWSLDDFSLKATLRGHNRSVLSLTLSSDHAILISTGGDAITNIWDTESKLCLYSIFSSHDIGDVFCAAYSTVSQVLYIGAQNTSIQWYDLKEKDSKPPAKLELHPSQKPHRFFDSKGPGGIATPGAREKPLFLESGHLLEIARKNIVPYAHYGYVYCMLLAGKLQNTSESLVSGGGDGSIKVWDLADDGGGEPKEAFVLEGGDDSVLALAIDGSCLYSGCRGGEIHIWDLDTRQLIRRVKAHAGDVLTLLSDGTVLFSGGADGQTRKFDHSYAVLSEWQSHKDLVLASTVKTVRQDKYYITGGNDASISIWDISDHKPKPRRRSFTTNEQFLDSLAKFVSFKTVSSDPTFAEDCHRGASYLKLLFKRFGAVVETISTEGSLNPIVLAKFRACHSASGERKRMLFYGHYDVISADTEKRGWKTDPFTLHGINGYLYGRGVSDNKGPILAALFAVADLIAAQALEIDIVFVIEGEEECGSRGFEYAIRKNRHLVGDVDWILLANSYWIDDDVPCLTYGLRGVLHATVKVQSIHPDLHSGVDGSQLMDEALKDLVMLLGTVSGKHGKVNIPGFYEPVIPVTAAERRHYKEITDTLLRRDPRLGTAESLTTSLMQRWREPSFTVHTVKVSGPQNSTVIPQMARAAISLRLVPNQDLTTIRKALLEFLETEFAKLESTNELSVHIDREAEPWLGNPDNEIFRTLEEAIVDVWELRGNSPKLSKAQQASNSEKRKSNGSINGTEHKKQLNGEGKPKPNPSSTLTGDAASSSEETLLKQPRRPSKPLYIREGGSIASIRFLEKEFDAPAAHLPCGQASDSAHLDNERLRLVNLYRAREIFKRVFQNIRVNSLDGYREGGSVKE